MDLSLNYVYFDIILAPGKGENVHHISPHSLCSRILKLYTKCGLMPNIYLIIAFISLLWMAVCC